MNYYDVAKADDFERLFGHLAVGQNPTPLHNQYLVMKWDFLRGLSPTVQLRIFGQSLYNHINSHALPIFQPMIIKQGLKLAYSGIHIHWDDALSFRLIHSVNAGPNWRSPYKLYLFIDEYDNFRQ